MTYQYINKHNEKVDKPNFDKDLFRDYICNKNVNIKNKEEIKIGDYFYDCKNKLIMKIISDTKTQFKCETLDFVVVDKIKERYSYQYERFRCLNTITLYKFIMRTKKKTLKNDKLDYYRYRKTDVLGTWLRHDKVSKNCIKEILKDVFKTTNEVLNIREY